MKEQTMKCEWHGCNKQAELRIGADRLYGLCEHHAREYLRQHRGRTVHLLDLSTGEGKAIISPWRG